MRAPALSLSPAQRAVVEASLRRTCGPRGWPVYALAVQSDHVHLVLSAPCAPEDALVRLKSWATRGLREHGELAPGQPVWARHGSTRYLFSEDELGRAVRYVEQHR